MGRVTVSYVIGNNINGYQPQIPLSFNVLKKAKGQIFKSFKNKKDWYMWNAYDFQNHNNHTLLKGIGPYAVLLSVCLQHSLMLDNTAVREE